LRFAIEKRGGAAGIAEGTDYIRVADDRVIGSTHWHDPEGRHHESHHVLTLRVGKIVDMQGCRTRRAAERFARRG